MNFINRFLLGLVMLPKRLYERVGINTRHLQSILATKLMMDDRRPNTFHQTRVRRKEKAITGATLGTMFFSALTGLLFLFSFTVGENTVTQLTIYLSFFIFMLATSLISDFTSVLIDVRDNFIILPKPVTDRTFVLSRLLHIFIHVTKITLPLCLPGVIYLGINAGLWATVLFVIVIILVTIFTIFLINSVYILVLKFISPQKFHTIISYVQIFMAIFMYAGYQLLPRLAKNIVLTGYDLSNKAWTWLLPSYWFAQGWQFFYSPEINLPAMSGALLTIVVPPVSLWIVLKYFAPSFNQRLSLISGTSAETISSTKPRLQKPRGNSLSRYVSRLVTRKGEERMGFLLTWNLTGRSRDFRLKVYPSMGYMLVYVIVLIHNSANVNFEKVFTDTRSGRIAVISVIYMCGFLLVMAINQMQYSDRYKAAWIYFSTPIKSPGLLITGSLKAAAIKFFMPLAFAIIMAALIFSGMQLIPNILLGLSNVLLGCLILALVTFKNLPFSISQNASQQAGGIFRGFLSLLIPGALGLLHAMIYGIWLVVLISLGLSLLASWLLLDYLKTGNWLKVSNRDIEE